MNIIIPNPENLEQLKAQIKQGGYQNLHVISDFDRTLTYGSVDGKKTPSIISMLRDGNHLSEEYAKKAHALFEKYYPIEIDPTISLEEKKKAMRQWWDEHNRLLVSSGLTKSDLKDIVINGHVRFREGVEDFLDVLYKHQIPLIVFSASGCGDAIEMFFENVNRNYDNVYYVTNQFEWDESENAISPQEPVIHSLNKDETAVKNIPEVYDAIRNRKNVLLLGDGLGDLGMVNGFNYDALIRIGFSNFGPEQTQEYKSHFDIVLEGDGDFNFVNELIRDLTA